MSGQRSDRCLSILLSVIKSMGGIDEEMRRLTVCFINNEHIIFILIALFVHNSIGMFQIVWIYTNLLRAIRKTVGTLLNSCEFAHFTPNLNEFVLNSDKFG